MLPITEQKRLALMAYGQRIEERRIAREVADLRDRDDLPPMLRDAIALPVAVLALPAHRSRFWDLVSDYRS